MRKGRSPQQHNIRKGRSYVEIEPRSPFVHGMTVDFFHGINVIKTLVSVIQGQHIYDQ